MGNYNTTKVQISFGGERLEVEGTPTEVKELSALFYERVIELQKVKQSVMTVSGQKEPNVIFKDHH